MIVTFNGNEPNIHESCFIAPSADIIGEVKLAEGVNVWYGAVIRGDGNYIEIGKNTNVQDNVTVHIASRNHGDLPTVIGEDVTIGHNAIVHACTIKNNVLIGMGAIVLDGAVIEDNVIIGAGALVPPGKHIPSGVLVVGSPCKVVRNLTQEEIKGLKQSAIDYVGFANQYKK